MMRWSPFGIMMSANSAEHSQRDLGSVQWFSNLRSDGAAAQPERRRCRPR